MLLIIFVIFKFRQNQLDMVKVNEIILGVPYFFLGHV
jgi:hypothetical protein